MVVGRVAESVRLATFCLITSARQPDRATAIIAGQHGSPQGAAGFSGATSSKRLGLVAELVNAVERLRGKDAPEPEKGGSVRSEQPPRVWRFSDRLSD